MKKSLIALAVLASTGAAMAQSSVALYGIIDVNLQSTKTTGGVRQNLLESGGVNGSRWGLKGAEDLGGGLKTVFKLESGFSADTGAGSSAGLFNRSAYVGFAGGFGEVRFGNVRTAYDDVSIATDPLWDSLIAPAYSVWNQNYTATPGNSIYYVTPSFSGLTAAASYALGENKSSTQSAKGVAAFNVQYESGPIYASLGYQENKKSENYTAAQLAAASTTMSKKDTLLNASYDFGVAKLQGSYSRNVTIFDVKANQFQLGVDVPVGAALVLSTGYAYSKDKDDAAGAKRQGFGLGAKYSLSKRTFLYTGAVFAESKPLAGGDKTKSDIVTLGVNHAF